MAVAEFTLQRGVTRVWQVSSTFPWMKIHPFSFHQEFVSPGDTVPLGHKYKCQKHARVTHNLLPEFEHFETNHRQIVASLFQFMGTEKEDGPLPPLYVAPQHQVAASCILDFLLAKSAASKKFKLFSLPKLMLEVYNLPLDPADMDGRMTVHVATSVLEMDKYSHYAGIGCQFHEALENPIYCSEAIVRRHVFDIADVCCRLYKLVLRYILAIIIHHLLLNCRADMYLDEICCTKFVIKMHPLLSGLDIFWGEIIILFSGLDAICPRTGV